MLERLGAGRGRLAKEKFDFNLLPLSCYNV